MHLTQLLGGYVVGINAFSYSLFWYDKKMAETRGWRIPERMLQATALAGGWPAGFLAMKHFRHKTVKTSFQQPYLLCTALNVALIGSLVHPGVRATARDMIKPFIK
ncbi:hypothetical protein EDD86DRAFT_196057 [Gorgonomyces haynaldii]|nr:hypothetical protein EDD86DRAFT_196057 [Gorgonomyces haynaldii]